MKGLVEFAMEDGLRIVAEVDDDDPGFVRAGGGELVAKASANIGEVMGALRGMAKTVIENVENLPWKPSEAEMEIGIKLNAKAGAILTSVGGECHVRLKLAWKRAIEEEPSSN